MTLVLVVLLLVFPWLELWLMFSLGQALAVIVLQGVVTAAVGAWFARKEALSLWADLESDIQNGRVPTEEGLDAMMEVLGGWLLVIPGWITDLAGGAMLVPAVRRVMMAPIRNTIRDHLI